MPSFCFKTFLYILCLSFHLFISPHAWFSFNFLRWIGSGATGLFFSNVFPFLLRQMEPQFPSAHIEGIFIVCVAVHSPWEKEGAAPLVTFRCLPRPLPTVWSARDVGTGGSTLLQMGFFENYYQSMNVQHHKCSTYIDSDDSGRHTDYRTQHAEIEWLVCDILALKLISATH